MALDFRQRYETGKRLPDRVYYDPGQDHLLAEVESGDGRQSLKKRRLAVPQWIVAGLLRHVERALENRWGDHLFLADFGHGHFLLPLGEGPREDETDRVR